MFKISAWPQSHWTGIKERERLWVKVEVSISAALLISSSCSCLRLRSCNLSTSVGVCPLSGVPVFPPTPIIQLPQSQFCSNLYKKQGTEGRGRKRQKRTKYVGEGRKESGALGCKINKRNRQKQMHSPSLLDSFQRTQISGQVRSTYSHRSMSWICIYLHYLN